MMKKRGFRMNGMSRIYAPDMIPVHMEIPEAVAAEVELRAGRRRKEIRFYGEDLLPGNWLFRHLVLEPDTKAGLRAYEAGRKSGGSAD